MWVGYKGIFIGEWGDRLERKMKGLVLGRPFHSHSTERMVDLGVGLATKYGKNEGQVRVADKCIALANGTRADWRLARQEYEDILKVESALCNPPKRQRVCWRDLNRWITSSRPSSPARRGKEVIALLLRLQQDRGKRFAACEVEAKVAASKCKAKAADKASVNVLSKKRSIGALQERAAKKPRPNARDVGAHVSAAAAAPNPRLPLGMIDLDSPGVDKTVLRAEMAMRELSPLPATASTARLVSAIRTFHEGARYVRRMTGQSGSNKKYGAQIYSTWASVRCIDHLCIRLIRSHVNIKFKLLRAICYSI